MCFHANYLETEFALTFLLCNQKNIQANTTNSYKSIHTNCTAFHHILLLSHPKGMKLHSRLMAR